MTGGSEVHRYCEKILGLGSRSPADLRRAASARPRVQLARFAPLRSLLRDLGAGGLAWPQRAGKMGARDGLAETQHTGSACLTQHTQRSTSIS